ncbi:MAG TPA: ribbon-helix-helix domain-containing protein [Candidatus Thermoplasmatota archaeon]|nr:ribbon-helix-helix domain-containing protein [Candidatus Thermoplasmatota archaeon]
MQETERVTIRLPSEQVRTLETLVKLGEFTNLSEAIRQAVRELVNSRAGSLAERLEKLQKLREIEAQVDALDRFARK